MTSMSCSDSRRPYAVGEDAEAAPASALAVLDLEESDDRVFLLLFGEDLEGDLAEEVFGFSSGALAETIAPMDPEETQIGASAAPPMGTSLAALSAAIPTGPPGGCRPSVTVPPLAEDFADELTPARFCFSSVCRHSFFAFSSSYVLR